MSGNRWVARCVLMMSLLSWSGAAVAEDCTKLEPGKSLGPVELGMSRAQLEATGLPLSAGPIDTWFDLGPYSVHLEDDAVVAIGLDSSKGSCVLLDGQSLALSERLEDLAAAIPGQCGPLQYNIGATVVDCADGLMLLEHLGGKELRVLPAPRPLEQSCDAYVSPGTDAKRSAVAELDEQTKVCFGGRVLTADLEPDDVQKLAGKMHISTCERTDNLGATLLDCHYSGVRLTFSGPNLKLSRVEGIAIRE